MDVMYGGRIQVLGFQWREIYFCKSFVDLVMGPFRYEMEHR